MADLLTNNEMFYTIWEPKTKNRFLMYVDGIPTYLIRKTDRPKWTQARQTIDYINLQWFYKGKTKWEEIALELYDPIVPSGAQTVFEWFRLSHESVTGRDGYQDFYKKEITIDVLGPVGDKVEEWTLKGAFPTAFDGGELNWTNDGEPVLINLTLSYDYAILQY
jgi:tail tube protein gp19